MNPRLFIALFVLALVISVALFSMAGGTHHSALVYGADIRELAAFGKMMGFEVGSSESQHHRF